VLATDDKAYQPQGASPASPRDDAKGNTITLSPYAAALFRREQQ
jgi:hypothetical protein